MDFGVGFLSNNVMLPILDFFYGIVPSYGFAIIALTLVVRFGVYPLSAKQIRSMRRMKITQPVMQERQKEVQARYKDNPAKMQEEMGKIMQEFGNPLAGCLPLLLQMPILFALFATLRGSPFSDASYTVNLQILPQEQIEQVLPQSFSTKPQNIFFNEGVHYQIAALMPAGTRVGVGNTTKIEFQTVDGKPLASIDADYPNHSLKPTWKVTKGAERVNIDENGTIEALSAGDVTVQATLPGIAADTGFLFIQALGRVGAVNADGSINWDILGMVIFFGLSLYINQQMSGTASKPATDNPAAQQQETVNKITPIIFSGMFLFFPLPAGVLMYIVTANIFQTAQTFVLNREPLPDNVQKILEQQEKAAKGREVIPFEKKSSKKKEKTS